MGTHLFTGIYVIDPSFLRRLPLEPASVVPAFLETIHSGARLGGIVLDEGVWWDLGTREQYLDAHRALRSADPSASWIDPTAEIGPDVEIAGATHVGPGAKIGAGAKLRDCVLWDGTAIAQKSVLHGCIVTDRRTAGGIHTHVDF